MKYIQCFYNSNCLQALLITKKAYWFSCLCLHACFLQLLVVLRIDSFLNHVNEIIDSWREPNLEKLLNVCYWLSLTYNVTTGLKNTRIVWLSGNLKVKKSIELIYLISHETHTCVCTHTQTHNWMKASYD